jgi:hypothetical protein
VAGPAWAILVAHCRRTTRGREQSRPPVRAWLAGDRDAQLAMTAGWPSFLVMVVSRVFRRDRADPAW